MYIYICMYVCMYVCIYIYYTVLGLPMTIDEISSVHGNFLSNEKVWAVSEIDAGIQQ